jgi:hypothetical protein
MYLMYATIRARPAAPDVALNCVALGTVVCR